MALKIQGMQNTDGGPGFGGVQRAFSYIPAQSVCHFDIGEVGNVQPGGRIRDEAGDVMPG